MRYHISPKTGVPAVCRAKPGNCPYGGDESHFKTYSEALAVSQEKLKKDHSLLPKVEYSQRDIKEGDFAKILTSGEVEKIPDNEHDFKTLLRTTKDRKFVMGIINNSIKYDSDWDSDKIISIALQNPNLSKEFIDDVVSNEDKYSIVTRRNAMLNPLVSKEQILEIAETSSDEFIGAIGMKNKNIDEEFIMDMYYNDNEKLRKLPWILLTKNPNVSHIEFEKWFDYLEERNIEYPKIYLNSINGMYNDWMVKKNEEN